MTRVRGQRVFFLAFASIVLLPGTAFAQVEGTARGRRAPAAIAGAVLLVAFALALWVLVRRRRRRSRVGAPTDIPRIDTTGFVPSHPGRQPSSGAVKPAKRAPKAQKTGQKTGRKTKKRDRRGRGD